MQRSRRRKLQREAKRNPFELLRRRVVEASRFEAYGKRNRAQRGEILHAAGRAERARLARDIDAIQAAIR